MVGHLATEGSRRHTLSAMATTYYCAACLNSFSDNVHHCPNLGCHQSRPSRGWGALLTHGDVFDRRYHVVKMLAVGGAGITYLAQELSGDDVPFGPELAIKVLFAQRDSGPFLRRLANEAQILQDLQHPNILECRGFVNRVGSEPYLLTLFERGGTLQDHVRRVGPLPPDVAASITCQVLRALDTAHRRGIVHRDLKPQNVLLRSDVSRQIVPHCLVADFGIAKVSGTLSEGLTQVGTFVGTPEFASPEQFTGLAPEPAADVFAAGGVMYFLLTGRPPVTFSHRTDIPTCIRELLEAIPPTLPEIFDQPTTEILQGALAGMMTAKVHDRWTATQVVEQLQQLTASTASLFPDDFPDGDTVDDDPMHFATMVPGDLFLDTDADTMDTPALSDGLPLTSPAPYSPVPTMEPPPVRTAPPTPTTKAPRPQRMRMKQPKQPWYEQPVVQEASKGALSMDDLFGGTSSTKTESPPLGLGNDLSLDDLFADPAALASPPDEPMPAVSSPVVKPASTPPAPVVDPWEPASPAPLPSPTPTDPAEVLRALGSVALPQRNALQITGEMLHSAPQSSDLGACRGYCLAVSQLERADKANTLRGMLAHPNASVRCCAAEALGVVGTAGMLTALNRLLTDPEPQVRCTSALALARLCTRHGRQSMGRNWIARLTNDGDPMVQAAEGLAQQILDGMAR
jgi:serine/threonine protein kinase